MKVIEDFALTGKTVIDDVHYKQIPAKFTGQVMFYTFDKKFMNGYQYTHGVITGTIGIVLNQTTTGLQVAQSGLRTNSYPCGIVAVYQTWCDYGGSVDNPYKYSNGCGQMYLYSYFVYCNGDSTDGSGGGGANGDGTPPPCPPGTTQSVNGLKINIFPGGGDDGGDGGDGGSGGGTTTQPSPCVPLTTPVNPLDTISELSIRTNAKIDCIYQSLKNNNVFKTLISAYLANPTYNLSFKVGPLADTLNGITKFDSNYNNGNVTITLNQNNVDTRFAFDIVKTFIHEAYHAYITQILIEHGGPWGLFYNRNDFNKPLNEIFDAYINYGVDVQRTEASTRGIVFDDNTAQHVLIASEVDKIAIGIRQYVESKFPNLVNNPNITLDNYRAVAWKGLENTAAFKQTWGTSSNTTYNNLIATLKANTTYDCQ